MTLGTNRGQEFTNLRTPRLQLLFTTREKHGEIFEPNILIHRMYHLYVKKAPNAQNSIIYFYPKERKDELQYMCTYKVRTPSHVVLITQRCNGLT